MSVLGLTFLAIFLVELPDKTFLATLVLATKYRPLYAWIGVSLAFAVQTLIAVAVGGVVNLLPKDAIHIVAGLMFLAGAVVLVREGLASQREAEEEEEYDEKVRPARGWHQILAAFLVLFAAEWGDLSQLLTITFVARYHQPVLVFVGALGALLVVSGLAVVIGRQLLRWIKVHVLHFLGATVCLVLGVLTLVQAVS